MSLDVYLRVDTPIKVKNGTGIFVRENGKIRELTEKEAEARYEEHLVSLPQEEYSETNIVYYDNITHNLNEMATEAGIYKELWRPEEIGITKAEQLIPSLEIGLYRLKTSPELYKLKNPENGWGRYEDLVAFVENYLDACKTYKDAHVEVSR